MVCTYVHRENRSLIQSPALMRSALINCVLEIRMLLVLSLVPIWYNRRTHDIFQYPVYNINSLQLEHRVRTNVHI